MLTTIESKSYGFGIASIEMLIADYHKANDLPRNVDNFCTACRMVAIAKDMTVRITIEERKRNSVAQNIIVALFRDVGDPSNEYTQGDC